MDSDVAGCEEGEEKIKSLQLSKMVTDALVEIQKSRLSYSFICSGDRCACRFLFCFEISLNTSEERGKLTAESVCAFFCLFYLFIISWLYIPLAVPQEDIAVISHYRHAS